MDVHSTDSSQRDGATADVPRTGSYGPAGTDPGAHVLDQLNVLYRRRYVAMSVFLLIVLSSALRTYLTTRQYEARARLMIDTDEDQTAAANVSISGATTPFWRDPQIYYETQYRILTGSDLARRVIRRLDLGRVPEFAQPGPPPTALGMVLSALSRESRRLFASPDADSGVSGSTESILVENLLARVSVLPVPKSRLVDVSVLSADPALAARAADALADEYVLMNLEQRRQTLVTTLEWLSREVASQQEKVESSERAMAEYRRDYDALSLQDRQNIVVAGLNQLNDAVTRAKTHRVEKETLYKQVQALGSVHADAIPAILQTSSIQVLKTRLADLEAERATLFVQGYGEKQHDVVRLTASIDDTRRRIEAELAKAIEAIKNEYESAVIEERGLYGEFQRQKDAAMDLDRKSVTYTVLEREAESNRKIYETLLLREKELQVMANSRGNNVRLIDRAATPTVPITPNVRREVFLAIVAGLVLSLGVVFLLDYLDDTIKYPDDVTAKLDVTLLGVIPSVHARGPLVLSHSVPPEFGEAFRSLRTALAFRGRSQRPRIIMVTSAQPFEGKTTIACNLALALAVSGARVVLIDADLRRSGVHRKLNIRAGSGLSEVLAGRITFADALVQLDDPVLSVLPAGAPPPNPSELLGSDQMKTVLEQTRNGRFDWVILDTPPVLAVTDAVVLSSLVGGIVFAIGSEMTRRQHVIDALDTLMQNSSCEIGAALTRVDLRRNRYYPRYCGNNYWNTYRTPPAA